MYNILQLNNLNFNFSLILQGAERKTRDEERRAAKRKMTATGRKKLDELYHPVTDRSEFYCMSDIAKPPVLFTPADDVEKVSIYTSWLTLKCSFPILKFLTAFDDGITRLLWA